MPLSVNRFTAIFGLSHPKALDLKAYLAANGTHTSTSTWLSLNLSCIKMLQHAIRSKYNNLVTVDSLSYWSQLQFLCYLEKGNTLLLKLPAYIFTVQCTLYNLYTKLIFMTFTWGALLIDIQKYLCARGGQMLKGHALISSVLHLSVL